MNKIVLFSLVFVSLVAQAADVVKVKSLTLDLFEENAPFASLIQGSDDTFSIQEGRNKNSTIQLDFTNLPQVGILQQDSKSFPPSLVINKLSFRTGLLQSAFSFETDNGQKYNVNQKLHPRNYLPFTLYAIGKNPGTLNSHCTLSVNTDPKKWFENGITVNGNFICIKNFAEVDISTLVEEQQRLTNGGNGKNLQITVGNIAHRIDSIFITGSSASPSPSKAKQSDQSKKDFKNNNTPVKDQKKSSKINDTNESSWKKPLLIVSGCSLAAIMLLFLYFKR